MSRWGVAARAAAAVLAAAAVSLPAAPPAVASASRCTPGHGVSVVVEFHQLGGRDLVRCDPGGGGRTAARLLERQGIATTYVLRQPGFLCRLDGVPATDPCVNTPPEDAYWSLWWSDGSVARWRYASSGVDSLDVPDGGSLALVWDGISGDVVPASPVGGPQGGSVAGSGPGVSTGSAPRPRTVAETSAGLPVWVAPGAIGLLVAAAGTAAVRRRRAGSST